MSSNSSTMVLDQSCDDAVNWIIQKLSKSDLVVRRTFDLHIALQAHTECRCPNHGTNLCDCQMVVLLVYAGKSMPVTLICHGNKNQTWISVVDNPQQRADPRVEASIRHVMRLTTVPSM